MIFGGQGFVDATVAYIYTFAWGMWGYGWIWPILNRGNQVYRDRVDSAEERFRQAKTSLGRGIRLDNIDEFKTGFEALSKIWDESSEKLPQQLKSWVEKSLDLMNSTHPDELRNFQTQNQEISEAAEEIRKGITLGSASIIESGKTKLQGIILKNENLNSSEASTILQLSGADLLQYSMKHPPIATQPNSAMELLSNVVGSFVSTYLYTTMAVISFSHETNWGVVLPTTVGMSVALYIGLFQLQNAIDWLVEGSRMKQIAQRLAPASLAVFLSAGTAGADLVGTRDMVGKFADRASTLREVPTQGESLHGGPKNPGTVGGTAGDPCERVFSIRTF
jgi:hypothetical protein